MNIYNFFKLIIIFCNCTFILNSMEIVKVDIKNNPKSLKENLLNYFANKINQNNLHSDEYAKFSKELENLKQEDIEKLNSLLECIKFKNIKFNTNLWKKYFLLAHDLKKILLPKNKSFNNLDIILNLDVKKVAEIYFQDYFDKKNLIDIPKWLEFLPKEIKNEIKILYFIKYKDYIGTNYLIPDVYKNLVEWIKDFQKRNLIFDITSNDYINIIKSVKNKYRTSSSNLKI